MTTSQMLRSGDARSALLSGLPVVERRLELAGISTAVLEGGSGTPMVLLHGPGEHATKWLRVIPSLVQNFRIVAPDLPGHGTTELTGGGLDVERVMQWQDELIARTCTTAPILVGQIIGGAIAARYAARAGERVRQLILSDSLGLVPLQPAPAFGSALMEYVSQPSGETHDRLWEQCAFDLARLRESMGRDWEQLRAYNLDRATAPGLGQIQHQLMQQFGFPAIPDAELARITVPTTLIWGRHDLATPLSAAETASRRHGWALAIIEDAGDDPAIERPVEFTSVLRAVCTR